MAEFEDQFKGSEADFMARTHDLAAKWAEVMGDPAESLEAREAVHVYVRSLDEFARNWFVEQGCFCVPCDIDVHDDCTGRAKHGVCPHENIDTGERHTDCICAKIDHGRS